MPRSGAASLGVKKVTNPMEMNRHRTSHVMCSFFQLALRQNSCLCQAMRYRTRTPEGQS